ncbi:MAG: hypothetical protein IJ906_01195 [Oscillospiraceae bacterium]|nr:hypothetical protein [Oscillospiraceae bacterium]MBR6983536.1 hypothetical protein [Ruminococcus sp.]
MNPEQFILMMNDLPDSVIDSANSPVVRPKHKIGYMIPAVAACFIALISAAVYPKLRIQTPEITEPPAAIVTAETTAQTTAETTAVTGYSTAVSMKTTHRTTADTVSQIVTKTVTSAPVTQGSGSVQTVSVVQNGTKPITETVLQTETKPNTDVTDQTTINPNENETTQAEPIIEQSISVPVLRSEPVFTEANQEAQEVTCKFHEATEEDLRTWGDEAIRFDRSAYKLICATISGYCQDAVIVRGTIMSDDCQLLIAYLNEHNVSDPIEVRYLMAFPIEMEIQVDNLHTNMSQVLGETFFQTLIEEYSQTITIQY